MRLWHHTLIPILPRQQLISQWRECCCIARNIETNGTPNHILVNKILDYPASQFNVYAKAVRDEMLKRGYQCDWMKFRKWWINRNYDWELKDCFSGWHTDRYLLQNLFNLQEKYDCGGISEEEWEPLGKLMDDLLKKGVLSLCLE